MKVEQLPLAGALAIVPQIFSDERGYFTETFSSERYRAAGIDEVFLQDNLSVSRRGALRGLHGDPRMAKLVTVVTGRVFDVMVDLRPGSPTRLRWHGEEIGAGDHRQLFVPRGFLHGFLALTDEVAFLYKQSALYEPGSEFGIAWNDPDLAIPWPLDGLAPILSAKDARNPTLREAGRL